MKKLICYCAIFGALCAKNSLQAQDYFTGFDTPDEQAGWQLFQKGVQNNTYAWEFSLGTFTAPNCLAHYYPVGGTMVLDDWMVSPAFDFSQGGSIDSLWYHFTGFGTPMAGDTIAIYVLNGNADPDLATSKQMLIDYTVDYVSENLWKKDSNITISGNLPGNSYLAFRYTTVVNWLDVKFDNIFVSATSTAGLSSQSPPKSLTVFPNPSNGQLNIQLTGQDWPTVEVYSILGQRLFSFDEPQGQLNIELDPGTYFVRSGSIVKKVIVNE